MLRENNREGRRSVLVRDRARAGVAGWRESMQLSQRGAAAALGMSLRCFQELERGSAFGSELPRSVDLRTRLAMRALAEGLQAWPVGP